MEDRRPRLDPRESLLRISKRPKSAFVKKNVGSGHASSDSQVIFVDLDVPSEDETLLSLTLIIVHPHVCGVWRAPSEVRRVFVHDSLQKDTHVRHINSRPCAMQADRMFKWLFCASLLQVSLMGMSMRLTWVSVMATRIRCRTSAIWQANERRRKRDRYAFCLLR